MTVLSAGSVQARSRHMCALCCGETIEPGEVHHRQGAVSDGRVDTFRAHLHCHALSLYDFYRGDRRNGDGLDPVTELCLDDPWSWSLADIDRACDAQRWGPSHPSRERARALWQRFQSEGAPRIKKWCVGAETAGTALVRP